MSKGIERSKMILGRHFNNFEEYNKWLNSLRADARSAWVTLLLELDQVPVIQKSSGKNLSISLSMMFVFLVW